MVVIWVAFAQIAAAQPAINYPTFLFNSPFQKNGSANGVMFNSLLLNDGSVANQNGSIFVNTPQDLTQSFTANFTFHISNNTGPGGIAFIIEGDSRGATALGGGGQQIGYGDGQLLGGNAIQHSLALVYSTYSNSDQFQLFTNTSNSNFDTLGTALATQTGSESLYNVFYPSVTLNYESPDLTYPTGAVTVLLNGNSIGMNNVSLPASLTTLDAGSTGYFGFSATNATNPPQIAVNSLVVTGVPEPASVGLLLGGAVTVKRRRARRA